MAKIDRVVNTQTGEVLTIREAKKQFVEEYDGYDPTNIIQFWDIYDKLV